MFKTIRIKQWELARTKAVLRLLGYDKFTFRHSACMTGRAGIEATNGDWGTSINILIVNSIWYENN